MNTQAKGTRREYQSKHLHEATAYTVFRIALSATDLLCVQVKSRDWPGSLERELLEAFRVPPNGRTLVHRWRNGARHPAVLEIPRFRWR